MSLFEKKTLGIIGGMGPLATDMFFNMIIRMTDSTKDQDHIDMIILNHASMPDRTQAIKSGNLKEVKEKLIRDAKFLEDAGAGFIAVPCNTSHYILNQIKNDINVPIISMIDMAVNRANKDMEKLCKNKDEQNNRIGIMATDGTIEMKLYQKALQEKGLIPVVPNEKIQKEVMKIIYENVKKGIKVSDENFAPIDEFFKRENCSKVILACTELSVYKMQRGLTDYYIDAMEALAEAVVLSFDKNLKTLD